jgi:pimeloyl-ACP methyl ester carboxylesterase
MKKHHFLISIFVLSLFYCNQDSMSMVDKGINIGSHTLHYYCMGQGSPTLIIEVGFAESYSSWLPIIKQLSQKTSVFTYDRAGYGLSEPGPMPRHSKKVAYELKTLLEKVNIKGPYILIGHSLGALNMQVFANEYPGLVSGIILLDPPPLSWICGEGFPELRNMAQRETNKFLEAAKAAGRSSNPEERNQAGFLQTLYSEHKEMFGMTAYQVKEIKSFGSLPLTVIASGKANPAFGASAEAYQVYWIEESRKLAAKSSGSKFILAEESRHHIHLDAPGIVLDAINRMLDN